jgi:hypothetical protein
MRKYWWYQNPFGVVYMRNSDKKCQNIQRYHHFRSEYRLPLHILSLPICLPNVSLTDEDASVMVRLGESEFEDLGLQAAFQKVLNLQAQHVIELHARLVQDSDTNETAEQSVALEQTFLVLLLECQQLTSSLADLCQCVLDSPDFALVAQTELSDDSQLGIQARLLIWTSWSDVRFRKHRRGSVINHDENLK